MDYLFDNIVNRYNDPTESSRTSRYRRTTRLLDDEGNTYLETADRLEFPEREDDSYHLVTAKDSNRLDLISYQYYGTPLLYWVIAIASDIDDPLNVPPGTSLRIPSKQSLYGYKGVLA